MQLHKTDRARAELKPGVRTLGQRERTLLLMADGSKSAIDFKLLFNGDGEHIARQLLHEGFLKLHPGDRPISLPPVAQAATLTRPAPKILSATPASSTSADSFEGKRSLATTRMFLFDICERMFARRNPAKAQSLREALRQAKDRDAMLAVSREMIEEIEQVAGHERADSISERLAMLLPIETAID